jgi:hypothetical protein
MLSHRGRTIEFPEPVVSLPIIWDSVSIAFSVVFGKRVELLFKTLAVVSLTLMNKTKVIKDFTFIKKNELPVICYYEIFWISKIVDPKKHKLFVI